jgi:hypothetical protein
MKTLLRALVILLAGTAVALAFLPLGSTSWAENQRNRRGRGRPPGANLERPALPPGTQAAAPGPEPAAGPARGGRGPAGGPGGARGGRGGTPGLFTHFRGRGSLAGDAMRFGQILVLQIGIPAGLTLTVLAYTRRRRATPPNPAT